MRLSLPRFHIAGHIYYLTTVVYGRLPIFTRPSFVIPLLDSLNYYRYKQQFKLLGYVIMPDHLHLLIWPGGEATPADIMRDFKEFTAKRLVRQAEVEDMAAWLTAFRKRVLGSLLACKARVHSSQPGACRSRRGRG